MASLRTNCFASFTMQTVSCATSAPGDGFCRATTPSPLGLIFNPRAAHRASASRMLKPIRSGITMPPRDGMAAEPRIPVDTVARFERRGGGWKLLFIRPWRWQSADSMGRH